MSHSSSQPASIGLFGGAFDPPHLAHLALARAVIAHWGLEKLHVLPTGKSWHKSGAPSPADARLAMTELAFADMPRVQVDARELERAGPTYTIDTIHEFKAQYPASALVLQIGSDQAQLFHRWRAAQEIARLACISIVRRESALAQGEPPFDAARPLPGLSMEGVCVKVLPMDPLPHSATAIRSRVAAGLPIDHLVTKAVQRYIADHHLYENTNP